MIVKKIWNNNLVSSENEAGQEIIIFGKGLGWKAKVGDRIDEEKIENIFREDSSTSLQELKQIILEVSEETLRVTDLIVKQAKKQLDSDLNENIYLTLTDHISFAIDRVKKGIIFKNALYWEVKRLYSKEFEIGLYALEQIKEKLAIELPEDEAASIAIHLVNAEQKGKMEDTVQIMEIVNRVLNIVRLYYQIPLDIDNLAGQRFIRHLNFFAERIIKVGNFEVEDNPETDAIYEMLIEKYQKEIEAAQKIKDYVAKEFEIDLNKNELVYLSLHIYRVTKANQSKAL